VVRGKGKTESLTVSQLPPEEGGGKEGKHGMVGYWDGREYPLPEKKAKGLKVEKEVHIAAQEGIRNVPPKRTT